MPLLLARDVSVPTHAVVVWLLGALIGLGACIGWLFGFGSMCALLPLFSVSSGLMGVLPWGLRRVPRFPGMRITVVFVSFAALTLVLAVRCRM